MTADIFACGLFTLVTLVIFFRTIREVREDMRLALAEVNRLTDLCKTICQMDAARVVKQISETSDKKYLKLEQLKALEKMITVNRQHVVSWATGRFKNLEGAPAERHAQMQKFRDQIKDVEADSCLRDSSNAADIKNARALFKNGLREHAVYISEISKKLDLFNSHANDHIEILNNRYGALNIEIQKLKAAAEKTKQKPVKKVKK